MSPRPPPHVATFENFLQRQFSLLPEILDVEQLSPRVLRVLGQNAGKFTLQGTNTYILGTGSKRIIIDTAQGVPAWSQLVSSALESANATLSHILLTHWHPDHTGGVSDLLALYPGVSDCVFKHKPSSKTQQPIANRQVFSVEGATVRALYTPGHSDDHMCFILEEEGAMFTGDNIMGHGTTVVEKLGLWMESLAVMQAEGCKVGYPSHGQVVEDLPGKIAMDLASKVRRETRVLQALARFQQESGGLPSKGSVTVRQLVSALHGDELDPEIRKITVEPSTEEVLRKLAEDGKVAFQMKNGEKNWFSIQK